MKLKSIAAAIALAITPVAHADYAQGADPAYDLPTGRSTSTVFAAAPNGLWVMLSVPGTQDSTVFAMLSDDLSGYDYGTDWVVYTYDTTAKRYVDPGLFGRLKSGEGFWFIQLTGLSFSVDHAGDALSGELRHPVKAGWNMIGGRSSESVRLNPVRDLLSYSPVEKVYAPEDGRSAVPFRGYWVNVSEDGFVYSESQ